MEIGTISTLIGSLGFPIVACIFMAYYVNNTVKELSQTIANNTIIMEKILTLLDADEDLSNATKSSKK